MKRHATSLAAAAVIVAVWPRNGVAAPDDESMPAVAPYQEPGAHEADLVGGLESVCPNTTDACRSGNAYGLAQLALRLGITDEIYAAATQVADIGRSVDGVQTTGLEDLAVSAGWVSRNRPLRLGFEVGTTLHTGVAPLSRPDTLIRLSTLAAQRRGAWWLWLAPSIETTSSLEAMRVRAGFAYSADRLFFMAEGNASQEYGTTPDLDVGGRVLLAQVTDGFIFGLQAEYTDASIFGVVVGVRTDWMASPGQ